MVNKVEAEIDLKTKAAEQAVGRLDKTLQSFVGSSTVSFKKLDIAAGVALGNLAADAAVKGLEALGDAVAETIKEFEQYEKSLRAVEKTTGITGDQIENLGDDIRALSTRIPVATNQLLEIAEAAGQLGIRGTANIKRFTETIARLGFASDVQGEQAAKTIARVLNVTGDGVENVDRFSSAIVELGNNFAASESEILEVTSEVARATQQFNIGAAAAAGISTALRSLGVEAESGGTAIGQSFFAIEKAIRKGGSSLRTLIKLTGLTRDELRETFEKDALRVFNLFLEGLNRFPKEAGGAAGALERLGISGVRILKTIPTLASNVGLLQNALEKSTVAFQENKALIDESDKAFDTLNGQFQIFQNNIDAIQSSLGAALAPALRGTLKLTNQFLGLFTSASPGERLEEITQKIQRIENTLERFKGARILPNGEQAVDVVRSLTRQLAELEKKRRDIINLELEAGTPGLAALRQFEETETKKTEISLEQLQQRRRAEAEAEAQVVLAEEERLAREMIKRDERLLFLEEQLGSEEAIRIAARQRQLEEEGKFLEAQLMLERQTTKASVKLAGEESQARLRINKMEAEQFRRVQDAKLNVVKSFADAALAISGDNAVAALLIEKTFAVADVIVNDARARVAALASTSALPFPANLAALAKMQALISTQTGLSLAAIGAQTIAGFARMQDGGIVGGNQAATPGPDNQFILARQGEMFLNSRQQATTFRMINEGVSPNSETNRLLNEVVEGLRMLAGSPTVVEINDVELGRAVRDVRERGLAV